MRPETFPERVLWIYLIGTYGFYALGAQYLAAWGLAWCLTGYLVYQWWQGKYQSELDRPRVATAVWLWIAGMMLMTVPVVMGHLDFQLGLPRTIASLVKWSREWALFALFPLIGCFRIRPQLIYRGVCIVCLQSLVFAAIGYSSYLIGLPETLYTSPLKLGGGTEALYRVSLFAVEAGNNEPRMLMFAPWAPALGLMGAIYFFLAQHERHTTWRWIGTIGGAVMAVSSLSRLAVVCLPATAFATWYLTNLMRPYVLVLSGIGSFVIGSLAPYLLLWSQELLDRIRDLRRGSSEIREALNRIGLYRWRNDAMWWGHGLAAPGNKLTQDMLIGSHHMWVGLLFRHGIAGLVMFAIPMAWSFAHLAIAAQRQATARAALSVAIVLLCFTLGEGIEGLTYLYWPGLVIMGIAFRESIQAPMALSRQSENNATGASESSAPTSSATAFLTASRNS
ncbi:MAG: O-antigen ligase domain-containing protein [Cyanobacteria bacterium P01_D01_bin.123]